MKAQSSQTWIAVNTSKGMFPSEYAVSLTLSNGKEVSFFVNKDLIKEESNKHLLNVTLINQFPKKKQQLVLLPVQPFENHGSIWATVNM